MTAPPLERMQVNGVVATADVLRSVALLNYGHFTSMQVRDGAIRGLDLHLNRLARATQELFGRALDVVQVRQWMRQIVGDDARALSLRVNVFARGLRLNRMFEAVSPDVLITVAAAREHSRTPVRITSARYQRELPRIKHVGTFGLFHQKRLAQARGFDDVVFVDAIGAVSEGSIWNIGFFDDTGIVWPNAEALPGISMQLLQNGLRERGVFSREQRIGIDEIARFRGAFFSNSSCAVLPIARIDAIDFQVSMERIAMLEECYAMNTPQPL